MRVAVFLCSCVLVASAGNSPPSLLGHLSAPTTWDKFMRVFFERETLHIPGSARLLASAHLALADDWLAELANVALFNEKYFERFAKGEAVALRDAAGSQVPLQRSATLANTPRAMADGMSLVYKREVLHRSSPSAATSPSRLQSALAELFDTDISAHAYISAPGAQALQPHTDPYDVFVVHVTGHKLWHVCVPSPAKGNTGMTAAELSEMQEMERHQVEGCTTYLIEDLASMSCEDITLGPGDVLYLPKGVVHYATTAGEALEASAHVTYGLKRQGQRWIDFAAAICAYETEEECGLLKESLMALAEMGTASGIAWLGLATAARTPVAAASQASGSSRGKIAATCAVLDDMVLSITAEIMDVDVRSTMPTLSAALSRSFESRQELLKQLGTLENCPQIYAKTIESRVPEEGSSISRLKRSFTSDGRTAWPPPCNTGDTCSCTSCDCDADCDNNCNSSGTSCDSSCDGGCECNTGCMCAPGYVHFRAGVATVTNNVFGSCTACAAGKYSDTYTSFTATCKDCPAGKFSGSAASGCTPCAAGSYQPSTSSGDCLSSGPGFFVAGTGNTARTPCAPGTYSTATVATSCTPCSATPWPGTHQPSSGMTFCSTCPAGKYVDVVGEAACKTQPDLSVSLIPNSKSFTLTVNNAGPRWQKYRVILGKWRTDQFAQDTMVGYPREYTSQDTTYIITLSKLIPGNWYYLYMEPMDKLASAFDPSKSFTSELIQTTCGCIANDITGRPTSFSVTQNLGKIYFTWTDQSFCEDGFQIDRDGVTFTSEYAVVSAQECGRVHSPQSLIDTVVGDDLKVGESPLYCVYAYARNKIAWSDSVDVGAYKSSQLCVQHRVLWEAKVTGFVRLDDRAGRLPVESVLVSYSFGDGLLTGTTNTNSDGVFTILVKTSLLTHQSERLQVTVSKSSGEAQTQHRFECDGIPCTNRTVLIEQMTFGNVIEFTDVSSLPIRGSVFVKGTEHSSFPAGCPLSGARVCAVEHPHQLTIACAVTNSAGQYSIPAPTGIDVHITVAFADHVFVPRVATRQRAPDGHFVGTLLSGQSTEYDFYSIDVDQDRDDPIDFIDESEQPAVFQVAGGRCNFTMGASTIKVTYESCPSWSRSVSFNNWNDQFIFPAHALHAEIVDVSATAPDDIGDLVPNYFAAIGTAVLQLNLTSARQVLRWEYHPEPVLKIALSALGANDCDRLVIPRDTATTATISVFEPFWGSIPACTWLHGAVSLRNAIGEGVETVEAVVASGAMDQATAEKLLACRDTCSLDLIVDEDPEAPGTFRNARASVELLSGEPEISASVGGVDFAKFLEVGISTSPYSVMEVVPVVVTGHKKISDKFSVAFPEYFPLLILYDPPGDSSYAAYSNAESTIHLEHKTKAAYQGWYSSTNGGVVTRWENTACSGLGVSFCTNIASIEGKAYVALSARGASAPIRGRNNWEKTTTLTTRFTLETSEAPETTGDDLLITPALNVVYSETADIAFNLTSCSSSKSVITTWSLGANGQNTPMFTLKTYSDIRDTEIPELAALIEAEEAKLRDETDAALEEGRAVDEDFVAEVQSKIAKLSDAIVGWNATIAYIDSMKARAAAGDLQAARNLMPKDLISDPKDILTRQSVKGAEASLAAMSAISFTGGGHKYTYESESARSKGETTGVVSMYSVETGAHFETEIISVVLGPYVEAANGGIAEEESEDLDTHTDETSALYSFVLSDKDSGDQFDVKVFVDPLYGTFLFHTTSGSSTCPHEVNTYAREQPEMRVVAVPAAPAFPWDQATFKVQLVNAAKESSHYRLYRVYSAEGDGGAVVINGEFMEAARDFNSDIAPQSYFEETIHVARNDERYAYNITLAFVSACEMDMGSAVYPPNTAMVTLQARFLRECSGVEWAGTLDKEQGFTVNMDSEDELEVLAHNPSAPDRKWAEDDRLNAVKLEYRRRGETSWRWAQGLEGPINLTSLESAYGYARTKWSVGALPDGSYDLRLSALCKPAGLDSPPGIDTQESVVVTGRVDRRAPRTFAAPEPSDGVFSFGDVISAEFTEEIDCGLPYSFEVSVVLSTGEAGSGSGPGSYSFSRSDLDILCRDRTVVISLASAASAATLNGKTAEVILTGVRDLAMNPVAEDVAWSFMFEKLEVEDAVVTIVDMLLSIPWNASFAEQGSRAWSSTAGLVVTSLSGALQISSARLQVTAFREAPSNGQTLVDFKILPAESARRRRSAGANDGLSAAELADLLVQVLRATNDAAGEGNSTSVPLDPLLVGASMGATQQPSTSSTTGAPQLSETSSNGGEDSVFTTYLAVLTTLGISALIFVVLVYFVFRLHASNRELAAGLREVMVTLKQQTLKATMPLSHTVKTNLGWPSYFREGRGQDSSNEQELGDEIDADHPYALATSARVRRTESTATNCEIPLSTPPRSPLVVDLGHQSEMVELQEEGDVVATSKI